MSDNGIITIRQASATLGSSRAQILKWIRDGRLKAEKIIREDRIYWAIDPESLANFHKYEQGWRGMHQRKADLSE